MRVVSINFSYFPVVLGFLKIRFYKRNEQKYHNINMSKYDILLFRKRNNLLPI